MLNNDQSYASGLMESGYNVFLTGEAGTGKSFVLRDFIQKCEKLNNQVMVVAPTGIAALNVNGATIHRAFRAPIGPLIKQPKSLPKTLLSADTLICDEISMCRIDLFDYMLYQVIQVNAYRRSHGKKDLQLIMVGDFFQLPPVLTAKDFEVLKHKYPNLNKGYAFESSYWEYCNFKNVNLTQPMRQADSDFLLNLNKARHGNKSCINWFNNNSSSTYDNEALSIVGKNSTAEDINNEKINELTGPLITYIADVDGKVKDSDKAAPEIIELKIGARVMMLINEPTGKYSNGSFGTVKKLTNKSVLVQIDDTGELCKIDRYTWGIVDYSVDQGMLKLDVIGTYRQFPLRVAYAITIHKSQGQTYKKVNIDPTCWDYGQLYVALSRCKDIKNMHLMSPIMPNYLVTSNDVIKLYNNM